MFNQTRKFQRKYEEQKFWKAAEEDDAYDSIYLLYFLNNMLYLFIDLWLQSSLSYPIRSNITSALSLGVRAMVSLDKHFDGLDIPREEPRMMV